MLHFDLENEKETIAQYRRRVKQCDELSTNTPSASPSARSSFRSRDHLTSLATALGIDPPNPGIAD